MKTTVEITWDHPEEQWWLCAENIQIALSAYCKNTKFSVREVYIPDSESTTVEGEVVG